MTASLRQYTVLSPLALGEYPSECANFLVAAGSFAAASLAAGGVAGVAAVAGVAGFAGVAFAAA